jgi:hypothetical protein
MAPLLMLATAVVALAQHGPLGWLAAVLLGRGDRGGAALDLVWCLRWWRSTKAPERPPVPAKPGRPRSGGP